MQELEKILEEIDGMIESYKENPRLEIVDICYGLNQAKRIIRKHMKTNKTFEFDFSGVESFDCQCGRHYIILRLMTAGYRLRSGCRKKKGKAI